MTEHPLSGVSDALEARRREERRAVDEAGGGEAEGFELSEALLVEHASHADQHTTSQIGQHAGRADEAAAALDRDVYGEADCERHP
jgi:hypothetical protein